MPLKPPANTVPVTGLLKPGAPVRTHAIEGVVKRIRSTDEGADIQYLVAYTDPASGEAHERYFRPEEIFVPATQEEGA
jgi:hypothetical protein